MNNDTNIILQVLQDITNTPQNPISHILQYPLKNKMSYLINLHHIENFGNVQIVV